MKTKKILKASKTKQVKNRERNKEKGRKQRKPDINKENWTYNKKSLTHQGNRIIKNK